MHNVLCFLLLITVTILGVWTSPASTRALIDNHTQTISERHEAWMSEHGKVYVDEAEKAKRFRIFKENVERIEVFNFHSEHNTYKLAVNQFADLTADEFRAIRNGYKEPNPLSTSNEATSFKYTNVSAIPPSIDWRTKGAVTPIKEQGPCGN
ncbi:OLC1v1021333C1 [Oldenlandia corymbosa var. corymbosa]|uniref:OLC1v1021333C1 n=1 Tax=Oldenlandia corymbosa var. corymbosa TaxID=529605 RepID=A0AAV1BVF4_OLDCO|nr:OLC1v1021333C1 [Oldenlandia corymbosa var. corymbosa]